MHSVAKLYDPASPFVSLTDGTHTLLVDVSLCLDPLKSAAWLREKQALVMAVGHLEVGQDPPYMDQVILRTISMQEAADLQLSLWERDIEEREIMEPLMSKRPREYTLFGVLTLIRGQRFCRTRPVKNK